MMMMMKMKMKMMMMMKMMMLSLAEDISRAVWFAIAGFEDMSEGRKWCNAGDFIWLTFVDGHLVKHYGFDNRGDSVVRDRLKIRTNDEMIETARRYSE